MPKPLPVYALVGPDPFLQLMKLADVLRDLPKDAQRVDVEGERAELAEVLDELRSFAMFGGGKVVVVRDADAFLTRFREQLEDYVAAPSESATLILRLPSLPKGQRIYKAIDKLTAGQLDELLTIPGLEGILKADLNKGEMKRATGGAGVRERHRKNVAFVTTVLTEMRKPGNPPIIRNAAEWLVPAGGGAAKDDLFILTKTHDAAARAKKHGKTKEVAYFGDAPAYPADTADYEIAITSTRNIHFAEPSVAGEHSSKQVWLMEPKRHGMTAVQSFLVHEVQHDADKHERDPDWAKAYKSPEESWVRYKTEFRAYWVDGHRDPPRYSDASGSATDAKFDNAKQEAIFLHMYGDSPTDVYAEWLRPNYDGNTTVNGKKFKDLIHGYTRPEGINLVNSPRIDDFYRRLRACAKTDTNLRVPPLWDLKAAAEALDADDRTYVNTAAAAELQKLMKDRLAATTFNKIAKIVNGGRLPGWAGGP